MSIVHNTHNLLKLVLIIYFIIILQLMLGEV